MFVMPTYWGFAAMQMGVQVMAAQMRMAQAIYEAGLSQQRALWGMWAPLAPALRGARQRRTAPPRRAARCRASGSWTGRGA